MNEKLTAGAKPLRPTKKQKELLAFIEKFIAEHGYSPSYREIMGGCDYNSVATVSLHVNNLIKRGHLNKRDHSARSLEVANANEPGKVTSNQVAPSEEKWLVEKVEHAFQQAEQAGPAIPSETFENLSILVSSLKILGLEGAAQSFLPRLVALKKQSSE
jgi:repressor LexA